MNKIPWFFSESVQKEYQSIYSSSVSSRNKVESYSLLNAKVPVLSFSYDADRLIYLTDGIINEGNSSSEQLQDELAFRQSAEDSMVTGMLVTDLSGTIRYINKAFSTMTGWEHFSLIGRSAPFPFLSSLRDESHYFIWTSVSVSVQQGVDICLNRRDGSFLDVRFYGSPLINSRKKVCGWVSTIVDISEQKNNQKNMEIFLQRCGRVLDALDFSISVYDENSNDLLFANAYYKKYFGYHRSHHLLFMQFLEVKKNTQDNLGYGVFVPEVELWFDVRTQQIQWVDGRLVTMLTATDITQRKKEHAMYRAQQKRAQKVSHLVLMGEMASSLSHELNQPLTAMINYSTGCMQRIIDKTIELLEVHDLLSKISIQAYRSGRIIRSIRDFIKKNQPNFGDCNIEKVVRQAVSYVLDDQKEECLQLFLHIPSHLPSIHIDEILIEQLLVNLLKNAIEASAETDEVHVTVEWQQLCIHIVIADQGVGIPPAVMKRLFTPFFTTKEHGMGMGLNICRSIVEYHKGRLWAESQFNKGTEFHVILPTGLDYEK